MEFVVTLALKVKGEKEVVVMMDSDGTIVPRVDIGTKQGADAIPTRDVTESIS